MNPALSTSQLLAIKTAIQADAALLAFANDGAFTPILAAFNAPAVPDFWVWRTAVRKDEYTQEVSPDATTFNWTGAGFITRSQGERDAWRELFNGGGRGNNSVNPSLTNVRQAFADIFSGATAPAPANRTHLTAMSRRKALRAERILATGTGSTASPGLMGPEGELTLDEVVSAWRG